ncbi:MAG: tetratricopeptide repeat protein [Spirochaetales bacterium]
MGSILKYVCILASLLSLGVSIGAQDWDERMDRIDELHFAERHSEALDVAEQSLENARSEDERAAALWRLARARLNRVDLGLYAGTVSEDEAREALERGVEEAREAVEIDGELARAFFWRGANRAKNGELRGVLNSLFMAGDVRDDALRAIELDPTYSNSYYMLGQLYRRVPGSPISFGDRQEAVSYSREAVRRHEEELDSDAVPVRFWDYYVKLADHLRARGWSASRRSRSDSDADADISDREEAEELLEYVISNLEMLDSRTIRQDRTLEEARAMAE